MLCSIPNLIKEGVKDRVSNLYFLERQEKDEDRYEGDSVVLSVVKGFVYRLL